MTEKPSLRVISLGAGVQSSTLALMAAHGELEPMPDCAIFADTRWEPKAVYQHLQWLAGQLPFPVHDVGSKDLRKDLQEKYDQDSTKRFVSVPFFTINPMTGEKGMGRRQCTREFKLEALTQHQRRWLLNLKKGQRVPKAITIEVWIGITTDEAQRMKNAWDKWQHNRWPLIEKNMSREDCKRWLTKHGYPIPPKSSCVICPYHSDEYWMDMRDNRPDEWADAVETDKMLRKNGIVRGMESVEYIHGSLKPLDEVEFAADGQLSLLEGFGNECEGMCGV